VSRVCRVQGLSVQGLSAQGLSVYPQIDLQSKYTVPTGTDDFVVNNEM
jgi:hypothetical protein